MAAGTALPGLAGEFYPAKLRQKDELRFAVQKILDDRNQ